MQMSHEERGHRHELSFEAMIIAAIGAVVFIIYKILTEPRIKK